LLTPEETSVIEKIGFSGSTALAVVLSWTLNDVENDFKKGNLSDQERVSIITSILDLRSRISLLHRFVAQPIPFSYVLLMQVSISAFVPLFAATVAISYPKKYPPEFFVSDSIIEYLTVLLFSAIIIGLKWLAYRLQDPFGTDAEDLPILSFVLSSLTGDIQVLSTDRPTPCSEDVERGLCEKRGAKYECAYIPSTMSQTPKAIDRGSETGTKLFAPKSERSGAGAVQIVEANERLV
jgi:predicted membrane chloride channel (bestrophin family)